MFLLWGIIEVSFFSVHNPPLILGPSDSNPDKTLSLGDQT